MSNVSTWLLDYTRDVYSQTGEDGIIEKILQVIGVNDKWCVEFGAWDGMHLTNTRHLIESKGYSAVLIEADKTKFIDLKKNYSQYKNVIPINKFVGFQASDSLDNILCSTPIPKNFDFLSIDIDGNDYHVWKAMSQYTPKVVVVEFNPTIPTHVRFVQKPEPHISQGSSLLSLVELAKDKGYELVSVLPFNAFFVRKEYYSLFDLESNAPEKLRIHLDAITYIFSGYDGTVFLEGNRKLLWHGINYDESAVQQLPKYFRKFPGYYSNFQKRLFRYYLRAKSIMNRLF